MIWTGDAWRHHVLRTVPDGSTRLDLLIQGALGIASEWGELMEAWERFDDAGVVAEAGDLLWYCGLAAHALGGTLDGAEDSEWAEPDLSTYALAAIEVGRACGVVEKTHRQGHDLDRPQALDAVRRVAFVAVAFASEPGRWDWDPIMSANAAKLRQRYPNGFCAADSISRVDQGEA